MRLCRHPTSIAEASLLCPRPGMGTEYCDQHVCMYVCLSVYPLAKTYVQFSRNYLRIWRVTRCRCREKRSWDTSALKFTFKMDCV